MSADIAIDNLLKAAFSPDPSDTAMYHKANRMSSPLTHGEGRMWLQVFENGVIDLLRPIQKKHHIDALAWVEQEGTGYVGSFNFVCETLGLSPTATRSALMKALEARGGSATVIANRGPKKTPKLKGVNLCQQRQPATADESSSAPTAAPFAAESISSVPCVSSAETIIPPTAVNQ